MSGHYPFSGNANRVSVFAFYERYGLGLELQEKYYRWWYEWAKGMVEKDPELKASKGTEFTHFPYGLHAHQDFHLHKYQWCTTMIDLGLFIKSVLIPRLSEEQQHVLEEEHHHMLDSLRAEAKEKPKSPAPDIGYFRHT